VPRALTRARALTGPADWRARVQSVIQGALTTERDPDKLVVDVSDMRARMDAERHTDIPWEIKNYRGGLVDIEFISQYLQLKHAHAHPETLSPNTRTALGNLKRAGMLDADTASRLIQALDLWQSSQGLLRLTFTAQQSAHHDYVMAPSLQRQICRVAETEACSDAENRINTTAACVLDTCHSLTDAPADAARPNVTSDLTDLA